MSYYFSAVTGEPAKQDFSLCHLNLIYTVWMSEPVTVDQSLVSNSFRNFFLEGVETLCQLPFIFCV